MDTLLAEGRRPAVVLIQADEGPIPARDMRVPWQDASDEELRIKFGILSAYHFPDGDYRRLRQDLSPVNSYRVILGKLFGLDLPELPDRMYVFPDHTSIWDFHDVTDRVRCAAPAGPTDASRRDLPPCWTSCPGLYPGRRLWHGRGGCATGRAGTDGGMAQTYPNHGRIDGPIVIIGFGSIGQGTLPLIERHFTYDPHRVHVIEPSDEHRTFLEQRGVHFVHHPVTRENYRAMLTQLFPEGRGFCVNLSVDTSSLELMRLCRELGVLYVDTVVEPWAGHYFDLSLTPADRTNYALREAVRAEKRANPGRVDRGLLLRRQPGDGVLAPEGGAAAARGRQRAADRAAGGPRRPGRG